MARGEGEQARVRKHWTDTAPPYGREKEGTSWWEATAPVPLGETVITTIRLSLTCRRFYAAEAALDGISLLTVQIYGSTIVRAAHGRLARTNGPAHHRHDGLSGEHGTLPWKGPDSSAAVGPLSNAEHSQGFALDG